MSMISIDYQIRNRNTLRTLQKNVNLLTSGYVSVGIHADVLTKRARGKTGGESMAAIARKNELGSRAERIPARPFMANTMRYQGDAMQQLMLDVGHMIINRRFTPLQGYNVIGYTYEMLLRNTILQQVPPPNAPYTIVRKGSSTPLIDTGQMFRAITYRIIRGARNNGST